MGAELDWRFVDMSDTKKIIAVVGATGAQGSGLVNAILDDPDGGFAVRAITRDAGSAKARALAARGAEVVAADIDDETSLVSALRGAYGAFFVTFYWAHFSPEKEKAEAKNMARAAKAAGLRHVIWSTLEDTRQWVPLSDTRMPTLMDHYKVPHFDGKGESNAFFTELGVPTTFLYTSFFWDNVAGPGMGPKRGSDGVLTLTLPMGDRKLAGIASGDIGRAAYGIFKKGDAYIGKSVGIAGGHLTGSEMAASLTRALGEEVRYQSIGFDDYRALGFPGADDLGNMFQVYHDFEEPFGAARSVEETRALAPGLKTFDSWLAENKSQIPRG
jgi:uncharacterized protein YbjT (DUF2867 family)